MKGRVRNDILEYLKSQQYVSVQDALDHVHYPLDDVDEAQFEADFDVTLNYFLEHIEAIPEPSPPASFSPREEYTHCLRCKDAFTDSNVYSALGWKETQISGFCESCFDTVTKEPGDVEV